MTLAFSTKFPKDKGILSGKPTYFVEQIWNGLPYTVLASLAGNSKATEANHRYFFGDEDTPSLMDRKYPEYSGTLGKGVKKHTIRRDLKNKWKVGHKIHFAINNRTKSRFQFAPVLECRGIEKISIKWYHSKTASNVYVDLEGLNIACCIFNAKAPNDPILTCNKVFHSIYQNDGFKDHLEFFAWFNNDFEGKILHWHNLKYYRPDLNTFKIEK